jgi:L-fucose isomerase-like protein
MNAELKIGLAGFFHANARGDEAAFARAATELSDWANRHQATVLIADCKIYTAADADTVIRQLNDESVDFTLLMSASVANGDAIKPFADLASRIGLWSLPEAEQTGFLPMNSFCGTMVMAGMLGTYLRDRQIPFKWFYDYPSTPFFQERFSVTIAALRAIKTLRQSRIGCVGPLVTGFDHLAVDEALIKTRFGTTVSRVHAVEEIVEIAERIDTNRVLSEVSQILSEGRLSAKVSQDALVRFARLNLALMDLAEANHYDALAISCWSRLQQLFEVVACGSVSRLNQAGLVASCEADIDGAIGMLIDRAMSGSPATLVDLVSLDLSDESLNLWHCGPAPRCLADDHGLEWDEHFDMGERRDGEWCGLGAVASLRFKPGRITLSRISSKLQQLYAMTATVIDKPSYQGSSGWVRDYAMQGQKPTLKDLMSMVYNYRLDHHMTVGYGDHEAAYLEFAHWLGLSVCQPTTYVTHMELDQRQLR